MIISFSQLKLMSVTNTIYITVLTHRGAFNFSFYMTLYWTSIIWLIWVNLLRIKIYSHICKAFSLKINNLTLFMYIQITSFIYVYKWYTYIKELAYVIGSYSRVHFMLNSIITMKLMLCRLCHAVKLNSLEKFWNRAREYEQDWQ